MLNTTIRLARFTRAYSIALDVCAFCKQDLSKTIFHDWKSVDESLISSLCQECQDETFGEIDHE